MIAPDLKDPDLKDIVASIDVALPAHEAFRSFLEGTDAWWPDAYLWSPAARRGSASTPSCDFGRILSAEPGRFACFLWELGGPGTSAGATHCASEVEARFEPLGAHRTRIHIRHRAFSRVGLQRLLEDAGFATSEIDGYTPPLKPWQRPIGAVLSFAFPFLWRAVARTSD